MHRLPKAILAIAVATQVASALADNIPVDTATHHLGDETMPDCEAPVAEGSELITTLPLLPQQSAILTDGGARVVVDRSWLDRDDDLELLVNGASAGTIPSTGPGCDDLWPYVSDDVSTLLQTGSNEIALVLAPEPDLDDVWLRGLRLRSDADLCAGCPMRIDGQTWAAYRFEDLGSELARDGGPEARDATIHGATYQDLACGGSALAFDGEDDYLEIPGGDLSGELSIEMDFWASSGNPDREQFFMIYQSETNRVALYYLPVDDESGHIEVFDDIGNANASYTSTLLYGAGERIGFSISRGRWTLSRDGEIDLALDVPRDLDDLHGDLELLLAAGRYAGGVNQFLACVLDDVRLSTVAREVDGDPEVVLKDWPRYPLHSGEQVEMSYSIETTGGDPRSCDVQISVTIPEGPTVPLATRRTQVLDPCGQLQGVFRAAIPPATTPGEYEVCFTVAEQGVELDQACATLHISQ